MPIIVRRNGGKGALVPFYHPASLLDEVDTLARGTWDSWRPFSFDDSLVPHTDVYEEKTS